MNQPVFFEGIVKQSENRAKKKLSGKGSVQIAFLCLAFVLVTWKVEEMVWSRVELPSVPASCVEPGEVPVNTEDKDYITYVDFTVPLWALELAYQYDISSYGEEAHFAWVELLAYVSAHTGGKYENTGKVRGLLKAACEEIKAQRGSCRERWREELKYYSYYEEVYDSIFGDWLGEYEYEEVVEGEKVWKKKYGLKAYSPIARYFPYEAYDDFGASRSYGYKRRHLGHDMLGQTGTPITAVESGIVEALGWNQYGGWRIGIRSLDGRRYYYYAHLRQNWPYVKTLQVGDYVTAGDVIGYMGRTGYSTKENVNNIETTHLHFGIQLIYDESQKESDNEIWIDCYSLTEFLKKHRQEAAKDLQTGEWSRTTRIKDPLLPEWEQEKDTVLSPAVS